MDMIALPLLGLLPIFLIGAAVSDVARMTIPNWLCGALAVAFFPVAAIVGLPLGDIGAHALTATVVLLLGIGLFAAGWLGGGDAKLLAATSLWLGWPVSGTALLWIVLAGGGLCLFLLTARKAVPVMAGGPGWMRRLLTPGGDVPYGVAIAVGALVAYPQSPLVLAAA